MESPTQWGVKVSCPQPVGELGSGSFTCRQNFRCHGPSNLTRCPEPEPPTNSLASSRHPETVFAVLAEWAAHTVWPSRVQALKGTPGMSSMFSFSSRLPPLLFIHGTSFPRTVSPRIHGSHINRFKQRGSKTLRGNSQKFQKSTLEFAAGQQLFI